MDWVATELADTRPGLIGVMAANNETGIIQPWRELNAVCQAYGIPFFTDAVQFIGKMPMKGLGECDMSAARRTSSAGRAAWGF